MVIFLELTNNATLLLTLAVLYTFLKVRLPVDSAQGRVLTGLLFGITAIVVMAVAVEVAPGIMFDGRSIVLSMAGLFGGPLVAAIAALPAIVYRIALGGGGVAAGIASIFVSVVIGAGFHGRRLPLLGSRYDSNPFALLLVGLLVSTAVLACQLLLPASSRWEMLRIITVPILVVFTPVTVLFGLLLNRVDILVRTQRALQESEARLRLAVDSANVGLWEWELDTDQVFYSPEWKRQIGYQDHEISNDLEEWRSRVHPEDLPKALDLVQAYVKAPWPDYQNIFRFRHRDGSYHWILTQASLRLDHLERPIRMVGSHVDITALKQAEQRSALGRNILETLVTGRSLDDVLQQLATEVEQIEPQILASILLLDPDGVHLRRGAASSLPEAYNEAIERESIGPKAGSCGTAAWRKEVVIVTDIEQDELWHDYRELALRHGLRACWSTPIVDSAGKVLGTFALYYREPRSPTREQYALIEDATNLAALAIEYTRSESALRESQQRFQSALENIPDVVVLYDPQLRIQYINNATRQLTGYSQAHFIGRTDDEIWPPEVYEPYLPMLRQARDTGVAQSLETELALPGQDIQYLSIACIPILDNMGKVHEILGITHDLTERRRNEARIRQLNKELEQRVFERTRQLSEANERLKELDQLKSLFIASMSHELRTPLNSIIGFSDMLLRELPGPINTTQRDYCQRVLGSGRHLLNLITDVIDISKIEAGKVDASVECFDLGAMIIEAVEQVRAEAEAKGLRLELSRSTPVTIHTDRRRLLQCVLNLLANAVKYTEQGEVDIEVSVNDQRVSIMVKDTGIGIREEDLSKLFQQFSRIDSPITRQTLGTGLGLYLSRKLARQVLRGDIAVVSNYGTGSRFTLDIARDISP